MNLLVRANLAMLVVFAISASFAAWVAHAVLQENAKRETTELARLMLDSANAVGKYTTEEIQPLLATQQPTDFPPQIIPSYAATAILEKLRPAHPDYLYREATLNPTNLNDRAIDWETEVIERFRSDAKISELVGQRSTPTGQALYVAQPLSVTGPQCFVCHSTAAAAPQTMRSKYGESNGFGWNLHEVVGGRIMSVPLESAVKRADDVFRIFVLTIVGLFATMAVVGNVLMHLTVLKPVKRMTAIAEKFGESEVPNKSNAKGHDEIARLARAFEKMRRSLEL